MTRRPPFDPNSSSSLLERWDALTADAITRFESSGALDGVLEALAMTVALETVGDLSRAALARREALRKVGARALLQIGTLLAPGASDEDAEERAEAARIVAPYARDGLRALAGKEPPRSGHDGEAIVLDAEIAVLARGTLDGFRLAEIATRVRESSQAQRALTLLQRLDERAAGRASPRLRLAADGASSVRDPEQGRRIAELRLGAHDVELYRFEDGVIAAYATTSVVLRLGGSSVTSLVSRAGYAEAALEGQAHRLDLEAGGERATLEL